MVALPNLYIALYCLQGGSEAEYFSQLYKLRVLHAKLGLGFYCSCSRTPGEEARLRSLVLKILQILAWPGNWLQLVAAASTGWRTT